AFSSGPDTWAAAYDLRRRSRCSPLCELVAHPEQRAVEPVAQPRLDLLIGTLACQPGQPLLDNGAGGFVVARAQRLCEAGDRLLPRVRYLSVEVTPAPGVGEQVFERGGQIQWRQGNGVGGRVVRIERAAEAEVVPGGGRAGPVAHVAYKQRLLIQPAAATRHAAGPGRRAGRGAADAAALVRVLGEPVRDPLPHVARHIEHAVGACTLRVSPDRCGRVRTAPGVAQQVGVWLLVAPGEQPRLTRLRVPGGSLLPLGLSGQPDRLPGFPREPQAVAARLRVLHVRHRVAGEVRRVVEAARHGRRTGAIFATQRILRVGDLRQVDPV